MNQILRSKLKQFYEKRLVAVWIIASTVLMVSAPFGTAFLSFDQRLLYWPIIVGVALTLSGAIRVIIPSFGANEILRDAVVGVIFALCFVPCIWILTEFILGFSDLDSQDILRLFRDITVFSILLSIVRGRFERRRQVVEAVDPREGSERPRLFDRFSAPEDAQIMRLAADNHYVDVFLDNGTTERLLMRLRDAVAEIDPVDGFYTHRSHWVCSAFAVKGHRDAGRDYVVMSDEFLVPVSRTYKTALVEKGFSF